MIEPPPWLHISALAIALVIACIVIWQTLASWHTAVQNPWIDIGDGHDNILVGTMFYKTIDPDLFSRDYLFRDQRFWAFYIPSFQSISLFIAQVGNVREYQQG